MPEFTIFSFRFGVVSRLVKTCVKICQDLVLTEMRASSGVQARLHERQVVGSFLIAGQNSFCFWKILAHYVSVLSICGQFPITRLPGAVPMNI